ncbi:HAD domain-containing protein [Nocardia mexicana]|uniref:HAD domain-containing protein n=1 Tax=Nocardia mexicana TaxID=279262 RepID=UPI000831D1CD|nr:HAD domain-containing protein [Nocardia mexicana]
MTGDSNRPLLFLDVDGTLLPHDAAAGSDVDWAGWQQPSNPALAGLTRSLGDRLLALGCELMWATGWGDDANRIIGPILGLPQLPVVALPEYPGSDYYADELHWKTRTLVSLAAGRRFIWIDDELRQQDRTWVRENHRGRALLHHVDGASGLRDADFTALTHWLQGP